MPPRTQGAGDSCGSGGGQQMKFVSFGHGARESWGVLLGDEVLDLSGVQPTLRDFIASPAFATRDRLADRDGPRVPLRELRYRPVVPDPEKIVCVVRNYLDHHQEAVNAGLQVSLAEYPPIFIRYARSQVGHGEPIIRPRVSEQLDWEGELAVIVGRKGRHIAEGDAMDHVAGYSVYNDASIREYQFHAKQIAAGKNFDGTGGFGPFLVTADEVKNPANLALQTRLNGVVMQSSSTRHMIFSIARIISYASQIFELSPGDVIVTGTPSGVGWSRKPPIFMKHGDVVEVEIENVGLLRNPVVNEG
jgi:2-keto-4-pentenoate hydratase/2-oxohepta-3-ene-1,7-dioic acid hydratase in catechol pathway